MKTFKGYLIPSVIAQIFMSAYAIVDGLFIGYRMNDVGLAAINIAWPITAFLQGIGFAFGISAGIYISRLMGKGEEDKANRMKLTILIYLLILSMIFGAIFFLFKRPILELFQAKGETLEAAENYLTVILYGSFFQMLSCSLIPLLKNYGHVKIAMLASLSATLVNFILDYIMIFSLEWGLEGAALASVLAQGVAFFICIIPFVRGMRGILFDKESIKEVFLGSFAPFILNYSYSILIILTNILCEIYGGDAAVAAYTVLSYMLYVVNAASQGTGDAIQPLFSYYQEIKEFKKNTSYLKKCIIVSLGIISFMVFIFILLRHPIGTLYGLSSEAYALYKIGLIYYCIGFMFIGFTKVISSYLYSINKKGLANALVLSEPFILTPLAYLIFINLFKLSGLWVGFMVAQITLFALALLFNLISRRNGHGWTFNHRQAKGNDESVRLS